MDKSLVSLLQTLFHNNNGVTVLANLLDLAQQQNPTAFNSTNTTGIPSPIPTLCFQSIDELAGQIHCCKDMLKRYLSIFVALGIVEKESLPLRRTRLSLHVAHYTPQPSVTLDALDELILQGRGKLRQLASSTKNRYLHTYPTIFKDRQIEPEANREQQAITILNEMKIHVQEQDMSPSDQRQFLNASIDRLLQCIHTQQSVSVSHPVDLIPFEDDSTPLEGCPSPSQDDICVLFEGDICIPSEDDTCIHSQNIVTCIPFEDDICILPQGDISLPSQDIVTCIPPEGYICIPQEGDISPLEGDLKHPEGLEQAQQGYQVSQKSYSRHLEKSVSFIDNDNIIILLYLNSFNVNVIDRTMTTKFLDSQVSWLSIATGLIELKSDGAEEIELANGMVLQACRGMIYAFVYAVSAEDSEYDAAERCAGKSGRPLYPCACMPGGEYNVYAYRKDDTTLPLDIPLLIRDLALLLCIALVVIIVARKLEIPYTLGLVIGGLGLGLLQLLPEVQLTPDLVLYVFLPPLLFEGSWNVNLRLLRANWRVIFFLAGPGLLLSLVIIASLLHILDNLDWSTALLLAAILSPTDPVAVLGLFRQLHVNERLANIIEGESLFNDGVAGSLYQVFLILVLLATQGQHLTGWSAISMGFREFIIQAGGGLLIGTIIALVMCQVLDVISDSLIEITATLLAAYGIFWIADTLHTSAITAVIVAGLIMGNYGRNQALSERAVKDADTFWNIVAFLANALIFLLIGVQFQPFTFVLFQDGNTQTWLVCLIAVGVVLLSRLLLVSVLTLQTWLKLSERLKFPNAWQFKAQRLPYSWQFIVFWSGLRGALSLALVLAIPTTVPTRRVLILSTYAVVLFTLLVQGLSLRQVLRHVLSPTSKAHQRDVACGPEERVIEDEEDKEREESGSSSRPDVRA